MSCDENVMLTIQQKSLFYWELEKLGEYFEGM